jgi:hypothetical protein
MGGRRGSRRHFSPERLKDLTQTAREILKTADEPQRRSVFISFASEDLDEVNLLRGQAKNEKSEFDFIDRSLQEPFESERAEYIKQGIRERINQSSVTLVYLSSATAESKWVDWEIRESVRLGKGVIGVYKGASPPAQLPVAIRECGAKIVPWTHEKIAEAIEQASRKRK